MYISKVNNINFEAGNVHIRGIERLPKCYNSIKKIACDKNVDILIYKLPESIYLPKSEMYSAVASTKIPAKNTDKTISKHGISSTILNKDADKKEFSVEIYNTVMKAIENLEEKIAHKKESL